MSRQPKPSHIPLFVDSYLADTTHLTTEQHGAYLLLMMAAWRQPDCSLPRDDKRLAAFAGMPLARWRKISPEILEMWTYEGGRIFQKRLRHEWEYVRAKSEKARAASYQRKGINGGANAERTLSERQANDEHHIGGGGGGGVNNPYLNQEKSFKGDGSFEADAPFTVIAVAK